MNGRQRSANGTPERLSPTPRWWAEGEEPDYRFTLANERTFLAWIRTALALIGGALALSAFASELGNATLTTTISTMSAAMGAVLGAGAYRRWAEVQRAMRTMGKLPAPSLVPFLAASATVAAVACLVIALA